MTALPVGIIQSHRSKKPCYPNYIQKKTKSPAIGNDDIERKEGHFQVSWLIFAFIRFVSRQIVQLGGQLIVCVKVLCCLLLQDVCVAIYETSTGNNTFMGNTNQNLS